MNMEYPLLDQPWTEEPTHAAEAKTQRRVKGEPWEKIIGHLVKMHVVILPESIQLTLLNFN
jgi:hypothetical protein